MLEIKKHTLFTQICLNRPEKRNALSCELMQQLIEAIEQCHQDSTQRAILLSGNGPVFCAGLDLLEVYDQTKAEKSAALLSKLLILLYTSPLVTLCSVHGASVAGGAALMATCDLVIAEEEAKIGFPEVKRGIVAGFVSALLFRQMRLREIKELLLLGEMVSAHRAYEMGLITRVVPSGRSIDIGLEMVHSVLEGAPQTTRLSKELIEELEPINLQHTWEIAEKYHLISRATDEAQEGALAFLEKRQPIWTHK